MYSRVLSVGNRTQWGRGGNVKEGLKLTPMSSFNIEQGSVNSGPGSSGVPEWCGQMDLASACVLHPLNRLVLDFAMWIRGWVNKRRSGGVLDRRHRRGLGVRGGVKACNINCTG